MSSLVPDSPIFDFDRPLDYLASQPRLAGNMAEGITKENRAKVDPSVNIDVIAKYALGVEGDDKMRGRLRASLVNLAVIGRFYKGPNDPKVDAMHNALIDIGRMNAQHATE